MTCYTAFRFSNILTDRIARAFSQQAADNILPFVSVLDHGGVQEMAVEVQAIQKSNSRSNEEQNHLALWTLQNNMGLDDSYTSPLYSH